MIHVDKGALDGQHAEARKCELWLLANAVGYLSMMDCGSNTAEDTVCAEVVNT